jgi:hypothetical protein
MPAPKPLTTGEKLRRVADELYVLAGEYDIPSRSTARVDLLVGCVERACADGRRAVRGPGSATPA